MEQDDKHASPHYRKQYKSEVDKLLDAIMLPGDKAVPFYCPVHGKHLVTLMSKGRKKKERPKCVYCKKPMQTQEEHDLNGNLRQMRLRAISKAWNHLEGDR